MPNSIKAFIIAFALVAGFMPSAQAAEEAKPYELEIRSLGSDKSPKLIIEEYASLTCPHCAKFHKEIFPLIKKDYIDTGRIYFIFSDFPLDGKALEASAASRCMPESKFFPFIEQLFEKQDQWAHAENGREKLLAISQTLGGDRNKIAECMDDENIKRAITEKMSQAERMYKVEETPSFVANGAELIDGDSSYEQFKEAFDKKLNQ